MKRVLLILVASAAPLEAFAQDYGPEKPPIVSAVAIPLTPEEKAALHAIDARIAGVEALVAKIDDPAFQKSSNAAVADLKRRRAALARKYEPALSESLMLAVISRYQVIALWLTPARVLPPAEKKSEPKPGS